MPSVRPRLTAAVRLSTSSLSRMWLTCSFDCVEGDHELFGDPRVGLACGEQIEHFDLTGGQLLDQSGHRRRRGGTPTTGRDVVLTEGTQQPREIVDRDCATAKFGAPLPDHPIEQRLHWRALVDKHPDVPIGSAKRQRLGEDVRRGSVVAPCGEGQRLQRAYLDDPARAALGICCRVDAQ